MKILLGEVARLKGDATFAKIPRTAHVDGVYIEVYSSDSFSTVNLLCQKDKGAYEDAKLNIGKMAEELQFARNKITKLQGEIDRGEEGRRADLEKYQDKELELRPKVEEMERIIQNPDTEIIKFELDECL